MLSAIILLAPESFITILSVKPPPNKTSTPHSTRSWISFQLATPEIQIKITTHSAITVSKFSIFFGNSRRELIHGFRRELKSSIIAMPIKISKVMIFFRLKLTFSSDGLNSTEKSGRKITHKEKIIEGTSNTITGKP